jgi:hypothetical protein
VDVSLAACCVGFALYVGERSAYKLYAVLVAAALARETGLLLTGACAIHLLSVRQPRRAVIYATAALPAACWYVFVQLHTSVDGSPGFISRIPLMGLTQRILRPFPYPYRASPVVWAIAAGLDALALAGICGAMLWALYRGLRHAWNPVTIAVCLFALLAAALSAGDPWSETYAFGRTLTPLLLLSALDGLAIGRLMPAFAMLAVDPRIGLQLGGQIVGVVRGIG